MSIPQTAILVSVAAALQASAITYPVLTDDFENYTAGDLPMYLPMVLGSDPPPAGLSGDPASIVGARDGVKPRTGSQMLQFHNTYHVSPYTMGVNSDLYYVMDVSHYSGLLAAGNARLELSAWFNTGPSGVNNTYFLGIGAYDSTFDLPTDIKRGSAESRLAVYNNYESPLVTKLPGTWEQSLVSLLLPAETHYVALRVAAHQTANMEDFVSSYADDVLAEIVLPDPVVLADPPQSVPAGGSTIVFLGVGLAGLSLAGARKKKRAGATGS